MTAESKSSRRAIETGFPAKKDGNGAPHMTCPIEIYMRSAKKTTDEISRARIFLISVFDSFSCVPDELLLCARPSALAPYPALSTAAIISPSEASPSTVIEFVRRFTEQEVTFSSSPTARSTLAEQEAQLMPVTLNFFIIFSSLL